MNYENQKIIEDGLKILNVELKRKGEGNKIGRRIKFLREWLGYTQKELAKKSGINLNTLKKYETCDVTPTPLKGLPLLEKVSLALSSDKVNITVKHLQIENFNDIK